MEIWLSLASSALGFLAGAGITAGVARHSLATASLSKKAQYYHLSIENSYAMFVKGSAGELARIRATIATRKLYLTRRAQTYPPETLAMVSNLEEELYYLTQILTDIRNSTTLAPTQLLYLEERIRRLAQRLRSHLRSTNV